MYIVVSIHRGAGHGVAPLGCTFSPSVGPTCIRLMAMMALPILCTGEGDGGEGREEGREGGMEEEREGWREEGREEGREKEKGR